MFSHMFIRALPLVLVWWFLSSSSKRKTAAQQPESVPPKPAPPPDIPKTVTPVTYQPQPAAAQPQDFQIIEGIGPKINTVLHDAGIKTMEQLANTNIGALERILKDANLRLASPDTWPEQAKLAAEKKWDQLEKLKDRLKGRRQK